MNLKFNLGEENLFLFLLMLYVKHNQSVLSASFTKQFITRCQHSHNQTLKFLKVGVRDCHEPR